jgi:hypothetical protein
MIKRSNLNDALKAKPDCLALEQLERLAQDSAPNDPHLAGCSRCQTELALLKSFESNEPLPDEGAAVAWISTRLERNLGQIKGYRSWREARNSKEEGSWFSRLFGGRTSRWLVPVSAALVLAIAAVALMQIHRSGEPQLSADAGNAPAVYRSQEVEAVGPVGVLNEAPQQLQWKAFPGAVRYKISIMEVDEVPLWSAEISDVLLTIPSAIRGKMLPGKPLLWQVAALGSGGQVLASSQVQRFSVQLKPSRSTGGTLSR